MSPRFARRISASAPKDWGMVARAADSPDAIHLELGRPVEDTPAHIKDAAIAALRAGHVHYSDLQGLPDLRAALAARMARETGMAVAADEVLITNGLTQASFAAFMAFLDPGDEVILPAPFYPQHPGKIELAGGVPVIAPLEGPGFALSAEALEPVVTPRTKMIALVNPNNPTGRVYAEAELAAVADLALRHDLMVVSDEVYDRITYDGARHRSIAALPGMRERTITLSAFTKTYAMDGWRLGWAVADRALMPGLMKIATSAVTHVNTFIQYGALAAVTGPASVLEGMVAADKARRDLVVGRLNQMPGVRCAAPEGTIYAFPDIRATGLGSRAAAEAILAEAGVVVESGAFYGPPGEGHLRICFGAQHLDVLDEAMTRMARVFNAL